MSCSLTIPSVLDRTKTVTRRHIRTWEKLATRDGLTLIEKGMGLPKGARQVVLAEVEVVSVRAETLADVDEADVEREGLGHMSVDEFRQFWAASHGYGSGLHRAILLDVPCRRIEWRYLD